MQEWFLTTSKHTHAYMSSTIFADSGNDESSLPSLNKVLQKHWLSDAEAEEFIQSAFSDAALTEQRQRPRACNAIEQNDVCSSFSKSGVGIDLLLEAQEWVDSIPLSRPRRHLGRDFADGVSPLLFRTPRVQVLMAEVIHHCKPQWLSLHSFSASNKRENKKSNWRLLIDKVCLMTRELNQMYFRF